MYKLLLCWRYLLTRYLALACIISVMLGVATLIVVNSVMGGFSTKLKDKLHGLLSDVLVEARNGYSGVADPDAMMARIRRELGSEVAAMSPTLEVFAMLQFRMPDGKMNMRPIRLIGVDPETRGALGGFQEHLLNPKNRQHPSFDVPADARKRYESIELWRQNMAWQQYQETMRQIEQKASKGEDVGLPPPAPTPAVVHVPRGIILGNAIASIRMKRTKDQARPEDFYVIRPGDEVRVITYKGGQDLMPASNGYVVCDYFKSEMSDYDANYVFLPLKELQQLRGMDNRVTSIQIRLADYAHAEAVKGRLKAMFPESDFLVETWEDKQGPLLSAIAVEKGILNVLLFLIIGVAGFGILAIFAMIVAEKTRDIGILKALGASNGGVMKIFLGYGLLLGVVGATLGTVLGLEFTWHINEIEHVLGQLTGQDLFPRDIYYFDKIPTNINTGMVVLVNLGAVAIAVLFSVLPALRAALLHPVRALRYE